ncbi:MAG: cyclodeaminase/cyclohydrolase family protein [Chloroflexota bacterium]
MDVQDVHEFLEQLASGEPVPGGGSVAALQAALAASLLAMVCNLTINRKKYAEVWDEALQIRERADILRAQSERLVTEDAEAYGAVASAMGLPRASDEEKTERRLRMQQALKLAVEPPLATMQVATEVLALARRLVRIGNRAAVSDVGVAALTARAAYHAARLNVEINLSAVQDENWRVAMRSNLAVHRAPEDAEREVLAATEASIIGTAI